MADEKTVEMNDFLSGKSDVKTEVKLPDEKPEEKIDDKETAGKAETPEESIDKKTDKKDDIETKEKPEDNEKLSKLEKQLRDKDSYIGKLSKELIMAKKGKKLNDIDVDVKKQFAKINTENREGLNEKISQLRDEGKHDEAAYLEHRYAQERYESEKNILNSAYVNIVSEIGEEIKLPEFKKYGDKVVDYVRKIDFETFKSDPVYWIETGYLMSVGRDFLDASNDKEVPPAKSATISAGGKSADNPKIEKKVNPAETFLDEIRAASKEKQKF